MDTTNSETFERSVKEYIEICEKCYRHCLKPGGSVRLSVYEVNCMEACVRREFKRNKLKRELAAQKTN